MNHIIVRRTPVTLNPIKLHCIILAMSCMLATDHADSFAVVVRFASVAYSSICFFPDRNTKWWHEIRQFSGCFSTILPGKQSTYTSAFLCGLLGVLWYLFSVMLMLSLSYVLVKPYYRHSLPITLCLMFVRHASRRHVRFCCLSRSDIGICWEVDTWICWWS